MVGVDEVGRGCLAGPLLVVAARQKGQLPLGLTDSKLLTKLQREDLFIKLQKSCFFGEGWVSAIEIDKLGLSKALTLGGQRALISLKVDYNDDILLDGKFNYLPKIYKNSLAEVDADLNHAIVSAASIYAKVLRDRFMYELAKKYPKYGFERHVGYGTALHRSALQTFGALHEIHRLSFRPLRLAS